LSDRETDVEAADIDVGERKANDQAFHSSGNYHILCKGLLDSELWVETDSCEVWQIDNRTLNEARWLLVVMVLMIELFSVDNECCLELLGPLDEHCNAVVFFVFLLSNNSGALRATFNPKLACAIVLREVFAEDLLLTAEVLTYHLHELALLPVLIKFSVSHLDWAATTGVLALEFQFEQRSLEHRMWVTGCEGMVTANRTHDGTLVLA